MNEVCLVIVFNHRYEKNIVDLKKYYESKFKNLYFLIPFYKDKTDDKVITVYDSSIYFQSYISQSYDKIKSSSFSHYIFCADDLLLNDNINESNILSILNLSNNSGYIKEINLIGKQKYFWSHWLTSMYAFNSRNGVNYLKELPSKEDASSIFKEKKLEVKKLKFIDYLKMISVPFRFSLPYLRMQLRYIALLIRYLLEFKTLNYPYPLAGGYSDFFIIPQIAFDKFSHLCGVFSSMNVFVEVAIPTAMVLSCDDIITENSKVKGIEIWHKDILEKLGNENNYTINNLFKDESILYYHPIKLSQWKFEYVDK